MRKFALLGTLLCTAALSACDGTSAETTTGGSGGATGGGGAGGTGAAGGTGGSGGSGGGAACTALTVTALKVDSFGFLSAPVMVEGADNDRFDIQFYELNGPQMTGTFDLAMQPDDNYETCDRCVLVYADFDIDGAPTKTFFQESGMIKIDTIASPPGPVTVGSLSSVKLVEVTIDPDTFQSVPVPNGACLTLESATWDTTPVNGTPCTSAEECANSIVQVCDVMTQKCVDGQCDGGDLMCGANDTCLAQADGANLGACYTWCTPFTANACAVGYECVNTSLDGLSGVCRHLGAGVAGSACVKDDTTTSCAVGHVCADAPAGEVLCQQQCTIFEPAPGCPAGSDCDYGGLCGAGTGNDPAAVGATCASADAAFGTACGPSAGAYRGVCYNEADGDPLACGKLCRLSQGDVDCPAAEFCYDLFDATVGVCYPDPVCGNNMVEPGETCDDNNTMPGDGCSATCLVEPEFYCAAATALVLGANMGDTTGGTTFFNSACNIGTDNVEKIYTFMPATTGTLKLVLNSDSDQGIYVRSNCADAMTELGCADAVAGGTDESLEVEVVAGTPVTIFVDGYVSPDQAGPFTLTLSIN